MSYGRLSVSVCYISLSGFSYYQQQSVIQIKFNLTLIDEPITDEMPINAVFWLAHNEFGSLAVLCGFPLKSKLSGQSSTTVQFTAF
jgi:hypothetical protein